MVVALLTIPMLGLLSDRIGRKPIIWTGSRAGRAGLPDDPADPARRGVAIFLGLLMMGLPLICFSATSLDPAVAVPDQGARRRALGRFNVSSPSSPAPRRWWSAPWSARRAT